MVWLSVCSDGRETTTSLIPPHGRPVQSRLKAGNTCSRDLELPEKRVFVSWSLEPSAGLAQSRHSVPPN